jgi:hypothetical protein
MNRQIWQHTRRGNESGRSSTKVTNRKSSSAETKVDKARINSYLTFLSRTWLFYIQKLSPVKMFEFFFDEDIFNITLSEIRKCALFQELTQFWSFKGTNKIISWSSHPVWIKWVTRQKILLGFWNWYKEWDGV